MLLGIDVGGTFTDAVIVAAGRIVATAKAPTTHEDLLDGILAALDAVIADVDRQAITRVALSTTLVTNALVTKQTEPVALLLLPGPGMAVGEQYPVQPLVLRGSIDHRGREVQAPSEAEVRQAALTLSDYRCAAVVGKFAVRNPAHELVVRDWLQRYAPHLDYIAMGHAVSGSLNFPRRAVSAYFNAATWRRFGQFAAAVEQAMARRQITAPVYVLKADGGTMPLAVAENFPVETIFTGPAASVLGIVALTAVKENSVALDIGGTTTDISLWRQGLPLFASRGAYIDRYATQVRAFDVKSVGIGGDSWVRREGDTLLVGPQRQGAAAAVGGTAPTVTDAMLVAGLINYGDRQRAMAALAPLCQSGETPLQLAQTVVQIAVDRIVHAVQEMIQRRAAEPVYRVEDIVYEETFVPATVIGVGGAAAGLAPAVARALHCQVVLPAYGMVANAVGAAVARPTIAVTVRADTAQGWYTVTEEGLREKLPRGRMDATALRQLAEQYLARRAEHAGIDAYASEVIYQEEFNVVRGFHTTGKIMTCQLQVKPGVLATMHDGEGAQ